MTAATITLDNDVRMPQLGLGTWPLKGAEAEAAVRSALELGYRLVDTAENYGNEDGVRAGIRAAGVARDEVFVTTKFNKRWHSREGVREAIANSLQRLGLDHIDLLLIHWPNPDQGTFPEAFAAMLEARDGGLIRAAGVSNFKPAHLQLLLDQGLKPAINQIQLDPQRPRWESVEFCRQHGIAVECWSPLGAAKGPLLELPAIVEAAAAHDKTPAQVVLRWQVQHGYVTIPKSADPTRQAQNLDIFDFELASDEMAALDALADESLEIADSDRFGH